jgi:hypothetical protein
MTGPPPHDAERNLGDPRGSLLSEEAGARREASVAPGWHEAVKAKYRCRDPGKVQMSGSARLGDTLDLEHPPRTDGPSPASPLLQLPHQGAPPFGIQIESKRMPRVHLRSCRIEELFQRDRPPQVRQPALTHAIQ